MLSAALGAFPFSELDWEAASAFLAFFFARDPSSSPSSSWPALGFFFLERTLPCCLATSRAYRRPHCKRRTRKKRVASQQASISSREIKAGENKEMRFTALQRSFCPLSPFLHSGLSFSPQLWHSFTPFGGFPPFLSWLGSFGTPEALKLPPPLPPRCDFFGRTRGTLG